MFMALANDTTLFQFTPLREGRLPQCGQYTHPFLFQFTPLREGRRVFAFRFNDEVCFNSRPCERGDAGYFTGPLSFPCFNSRPCERGDQPVTFPNWGNCVSIHAPARGATEGEHPYNQQ